MTRIAPIPHRSALILRGLLYGTAMLLLSTNAVIHVVPVGRIFIVLLASALGIMFYDVLPKIPVLPLVTGNTVFFLFFFNYHTAGVASIFTDGLLFNLCLGVALVSLRQRAIIAAQLVAAQNTKADFIVSFVRAIDARDPYTANHSYRVALYSLHIGHLLGMDAEERDTLWLGGLLHDIGKLGLPEVLLLKRDHLSELERQALNQHPVIGHGLIQELPIADDVKAIVRSHHERLDGQGYPDGLCGDDIPHAARITSVADAFDAMMSNRAYRQAHSLDQAVAELTRATGAQFDARTADVWIRFVSGFRSAGEIVQFLESRYRHIIRSHQTPVMFQSQEIAASLDVSRSAADKLLQESSIIERLFVHVPVAVTIYDRDGTVVDVNPAFEDLYGWLRAEVVGRRLVQVSELRWSEFEREFHRVLQGETIVQHEVERHNKDGHPLWVSITAFPIRDEQGEVAQVGAFATSLQRSEGLAAIPSLTSWK